MLREAKHCALKSRKSQLYGVLKADNRDRSGYGKILLLTEMAGILSRHTLQN